MTDVFKDTSGLPFEIFLHNIMAEFGSSQSAILKIFRVLENQSQMDMKSTPKNVSQIAHDLQVRQTSGPNLRILGKHIKEFFESNLLLEGMPHSYPCSFYLEGLDRSHVSLKKWTAEVFINAGQRAYFGDRLMELDLTMAQSLMRLDDLSWQVFFRYPRFLRPQLNLVSKTIRSTLNKYFSLPMDERRSEAWFTQALESEYRRVGLQTDDIASQMLFLYWG